MFANPQWSLDAGCRGAWSKSITVVDNPQCDRVGSERLHRPGSAVKADLGHHSRPEEPRLARPRHGSDSFDGVWCVPMDRSALATGISPCAHCFARWKPQGGLTSSPRTYATSRRTLHMSSTRRPILGARRTAFLTRIARPSNEVQAKVNKKHNETG